jgi:hypothetical protein
MGGEMTAHAPQRKGLGRSIRSGLLLTLVVSGALFAAGPFTSARAASNGMWSVFPTTLRGQLPREVFQPVLTPGKQYTDSVTVANYTTTPLTFHLYGADAFNTPGGGLSLRPRTVPSVDIGSWIKVVYPELTVPARSFSAVPFTILPPPQATPGDHVGGIVAEQVKGKTAKTGSVPITIVLAVGVRVYGRVVGPLNPGLAIRHMTLDVHDTVASELGGGVGARVRFTVLNDGNTVLSPSAQVELTNPFGTAGRRAFSINQLLPGNSLSYSLNFPGVSAYGRLRAEVRILGAQTDAMASATAWAVPWALLAVIIVVVLVLLIVWVLRRRRRRRRTASEPAEQLEPEPTPI